MLSRTSRLQSQGDIVLTRSELQHNPVALSVVGPDGQAHTVTAERVAGERVRITCSCQAGAADGWCRHALDLLCLRYDHVVGLDDDLAYRFEDLVCGTPLADLADEIDAARSEFERALATLRVTGRPAFEPESLRSTAHAATDLADAALHLDHALERFRRRLAAARAA
jgi:hypothetical protein